MILWASMGLHVAAAALAAGASVLLFSRPVDCRVVALRLLVVALGAETVAAALRWSLTGHPPVFGTHENTMACSWALILTALVIAARSSADGPIRDAAMLLAWVPLTAGYGFFFNTAPYPLTISERSIFIDVHVVLAWAAYAVMLRGSMTGVRVLLGARSGGVAEDDVLLGAASLGFVLFTGVIGIGALYSFQLFTRYFSWEIVETFSVVTWLAYALVLHQRLFFGWRGNRLATLMVLTLPLLLATYWTWSIFSGTYHFFELSELKAW